MISQHAKDAFDYLVSTALKGALCAPSESPCEVEIITDTKAITEKKVFLLTVSSYLFRVMTLMYFTLDRQTKQHFAAISKVEPESMSDDDFLDVIGECGNIFCGTLNRELAKHFPHLGMSTPNVLDRDCVDHLSELKAGYVQHFKIKVNDALTMHASLCVCDFADIDFTVDMTEVEESNGELELF